MEPSAIIVAGDWHGDFMHAAYIMERAIRQDAQAVVQVGDFGFLEHLDGGPEYLDGLSELAVLNSMPVYWLDGNHENHPLLRALYGPGGRRHKLTPEGFWEIRPGIYYIPRGTRWTWSGVRMMALGGAYSVDKFQLLKRTRDRVRTAQLHDPEFVHRGEFDMWWPEEEITEEELASALGDTEEVDILFTHDKPWSSNPPWGRRAFAECQPNAAKVQTAVQTLHVKMIVHGHLHFRYTDYIHNGTDGYCTVEGLDCNPGMSGSGDADQSWIRVELLIDPLDTYARYESPYNKDA